MTVWDDIYKNYNQGGDAWATLGEGIIPRFVELIETERFSRKSVFDIGCGTGKYLVFLKSNGFEVAGIDSSDTAVDMTQHVLRQKDDIVCADMFARDIPSDTYDLILSVSTIHHGTKDKVKALIERIHTALLSGGWAFITVPDYDSAVARDEFNDHTQVEPMTYAPNDGPEKGLPHSFYTKEELEEMFGVWTSVEITLDDIGRWVIVARK